MPHATPIRWLFLKRPHIEEPVNSGGNLSISGPQVRVLPHAQDLAAYLSGRTTCVLVNQLANLAEVNNVSLLLPNRAMD